MRPQTKIHLFSIARTKIFGIKTTNRSKKFTFKHEAKTINNIDRNWFRPRFLSIAFDFVSNRIDTETKRGSVVNHLWVGDRLPRRRIGQRTHNHSFVISKESII